MKKSFYISIIISLVSVITYGASKKPAAKEEAQQAEATETTAPSSDKTVSKADSLYKAGNYKEAIKLYKEKLYDDPHNPRLNYMVGACLYYSNNISEAEYYLTDAQEIPGAVFMKGDIYSKQYDFDQAIAYYDKASRMVSPKSYLQDACDRRRQGAENAKKLLKSVEKVVITDSTTADKKYFFCYYGLSENSGMLYQHKENKFNYSTPYTGYQTQREDRKIYSDTSSNQCDIYVQDKLIDGWSKGRSISKEINTPGDENFPFLQEDGITLYFGSTRHGSIGGYDIFVSRFNSDNSEYMEPLQLAMPFNSPWNDYLMAIDEDKGMGFWATDRYMTGDSVKIYTFRVEKESVYLPESIGGEQRLQYAKLKNYATPQTELEREKKAKEKEAAKAKADSTASTKNDSTAVAAVNDSVNSAKQDTNTIAQETEATTQAAAEETKIEIKTSGFEFKINDEITYTKLNDFISGEAKAYYQQGAKLQAEREASINELDKLRKEYANTDDANEKKKISTNILKIERRLGTSTKIAYENYFKLSRNNEIKAINNKIKQEQLKKQNN